MKGNNKEKAHSTEDKICQCQKCSPVITGNPDIGVWGFCRECGMRTPSYIWYNGAWAVELLSKAKQEGTSWIDKTLILKA
jgi:hypothetical protein